MQGKKQPEGRAPSVRSSKPADQAKALFHDFHDSDDDDSAAPAPESSNPSFKVPSASGPQPKAARATPHAPSAAPRSPHAEAAVTSRRNKPTAPEGGRARGAVAPAIIPSQRSTESSLSYPAPKANLAASSALANSSSEEEEGERVYAGSTPRGGRSPAASLLPQPSDSSSEDSSRKGKARSPAVPLLPQPSDSSSEGSRIGKERACSPFVVQPQPAASSSSEGSSSRGSSQASSGPAAGANAPSNFSSSAYGSVSEEQYSSVGAPGPRSSWGPVSSVQQHQRPVPPMPQHLESGASTSISSALVSEAASSYSSARRSKAHKSTAATPPPAVREWGALSRPTPTSNTGAQTDPERRDMGVQSCVGVSKATSPLPGLSPRASNKSAASMEGPGQELAAATKAKLASVQLQVRDSLHDTATTPELPTPNQAAAPLPAASTVARTPPRAAPVATGTGPAGGERERLPSAFHTVQGSPSRSSEDENAAAVVRQEEVEGPVSSPSFTTKSSPRYLTASSPVVRVIKPKPSLEHHQPQHLTSASPVVRVIKSRVSSEQLLQPQQSQQQPQQQGEKEAPVAAAVHDQGSSNGGEASGSSGSGERLQALLQKQHVRRPLALDRALQKRRGYPSPARVRATSPTKVAALRGSSSSHGSAADSVTDRVAQLASGGSSSVDSPVLGVTHTPVSPPAPATAAVEPPPPPAVSAADLERLKKDIVGSLYTLIAERDAANTPPPPSPAPAVASVAVQAPARSTVTSSESSHIQLRHQSQGSAAAGPEHADADISFAMLGAHHDNTQPAHRSPRPTAATTDTYVSGWVSERSGLPVYDDWESPQNVHTSVEDALHISHGGGSYGGSKAAPYPASTKGPTSSTIATSQRADSHVAASSPCSPAAAAAAAGSKDRRAVVVQPLAATWDLSEAVSSPCTVAAPLVVPLSALRSPVPHSSSAGNLSRAAQAGSSCSSWELAPSATTTTTVNQRQLASEAGESAATTTTVDQRQQQASEPGDEGLSVRTTTTTTTGNQRQQLSVAGDEGMSGRSSVPAPVQLPLESEEMLQQVCTT